MSAASRALAVVGVSLCLAVNVLIGSYGGWTPVQTACTVFTAAMLVWTFITASRR